MSALRTIVEELLGKLASHPADPYRDPMVQALERTLDALEHANADAASRHALDALRRVAPLAATGHFPADLLPLVVEAEAHRLALMPPPPRGLPATRVDDRMLAARDRPCLRAIDRAPYEPAIEPKIEAPVVAAPVDPDLPRPVTGAVARLDDIGDPRPIAAFHADVLHLCLDRVAMLARHRDERALMFRREVEERLLRHADAALVAGGSTIVTGVMDFARASLESAAPNPYAIWAAIFLLGTIDGGDCLDAAADLLRGAAAAGFDAFDIAGDAIVVAPSPAIAAWLRVLSRAPEALLRAVAVATLGRRVHLSVDELAWHLSDPSPLVLAAALSAASRLAPDVAAPLLPSCRMVLHHPDAEVALRAARTLALWGIDDGLALLRAAGPAADRLRAAGAELGAMRGIAADRAVIARSLSGSPPAERSILALGRFGHLDATAHLLHLLADEEAQEHARRALITMFGAIVPPKAELKRAAWQPAIAALHLDPELRYRRGRPWSAAVVVEDLASLGLRRFEAEAQIDELAARFGRGLAEAARRVDLGLFAPESEPTLAAFLDRARAEGGTRDAGAWIIPR